MDYDELLSLLSAELAARFGDAGLTAAHRIGTEGEGVELREPKSGRRFYQAYPLLQNVGTFSRAWVKLACDRVEDQFDLRAQSAGSAAVAPAR